MKGPSRTLSLCGEEARLTEALALRLLGFRSAPGRFLKSGRGWIPKWRFAPFDCLEDAFRVLDLAADEYRLSGGNDGRSLLVEIRIGLKTTKMSGRGNARTITTALVKAMGIQA